MAKILIVDDEFDIAELISDTLLDEGYETVICSSGEEAIQSIKTNSYDLILLDIMMPGMSGTDVCKKIRNDVSCPIIFISAKSMTTDKLFGFELGADDYITKPFDIYELLARVKAHLRREDRTRVLEKDNYIKIGGIEINTMTYDVYKDDKKIDLSTREFEVLKYLMENAGVVLTKEQIFSTIWGSEYGDIGTVAVHIKNLRTKLDNDEEYIKTVWGIGYKFVKVINERR